MPDFELDDFELFDFDPPDFFWAGAAADSNMIEMTRIGTTLMEAVNADPRCKFRSIGRK